VVYYAHRFTSFLTIKKMVCCSTCGQVFKCLTVGCASWIRLNINHSRAWCTQCYVDVKCGNGCTRLFTPLPQTPLTLTVDENVVPDHIQSGWWWFIGILLFMMTELNGVLYLYGLRTLVPWLFATGFLLLFLIR